jgi:hypothetical protein
MIKISRVSKLDGISSWSLPARVACPGAKGAEVCAGCYATSGNYLRSNVKEPRVHNMEDWKREQWSNDMIKELDNHRYFRWFDSGDIMNVSLAIKILDVCKSTPWVKHWIPTRSYKMPAINHILKELQELPNVAVRASSDNWNQDTTNDVLDLKSIVISDESHATGFICRAYEHEGTCNGCRTCWDKNVKEINYILHGRIAKNKFNKKNKGK